MKNLLLPLIFLLFSVPELVFAQSTLICADEIKLTLDQFGLVDVFPFYLLEGDIPEGTQLSIDGENYFDEITFDCDDLMQDDPNDPSSIIMGITSFEYIVKSPDDSKCWGNFTIEDKLGPVIKIVPSLNLSQYAGDEIIVTSEMLDIGTRDNCGVDKMWIEPNNFHIYSDTQESVTFYAKDFSGNVSSETVLVKFKVTTLPCELESVLAPKNELLIHQYDSKPADMTPEYLVNTFNFSIGEVSPYIGDCDFEVSYEDEVFYAANPNLYTIARSWKVLETSGSTINFVQTITNRISCGIDVSLPSDNIFVIGNIQNPEYYTPVKLVEMGFNASIEFPIGCESYYSITYSDKIVWKEEMNFIIIRTWTYLSFISGAKTFTHTIDVTQSEDKDEIICDILPRSTPSGNCTSGHTFNDSVEWPNDITISDYRIAPENLVKFSKINVLDSEPKIYENSIDLVLSYSDIFIDITETEINLNRIWTINHKTLDYTWNYAQKITINYGDKLVYVNTRNNVPVSGIKINDEYVTNDEGKAVIEGEVDKIEVSEKNNDGVNILDIVLIQDHLLSVNVLTDEYDILAADITKDNKINIKDIIQIRRNILGIDKGGDWGFHDVEEDYPLALVPKGNYIGVKLGDVNDSAMNDNDLMPSNKIVIDDLLLNKGATYEIPVKIDQEMSSISYEFHFDIDESKVLIEDVVPVSDDWDSFFWIAQNGSLDIMAAYDYPLNNVVKQLKDEIFTIKLKALDNSLVQLAIETNRNSYSVSEDKELQLISSNITGQIQLGVLDPALEGLSIYPNPASDFLVIDVSKVALNGDLSVEVFNANGQKVIAHSGMERIDISNLSSGMYFYRINYGGYSYVDRLSVVK